VESLQLRSVRPDTAAPAATSGGSANDTVTSSTRGDVIAVTSSSCLAAESLQLRSVRPDTAASAATPGGSANDTVTSSTRGDVIAVTSSSCLPEFARVGAWPSCYRFSTFNATWHEARVHIGAATGPHVERLRLPIHFLFLLRPFPVSTYCATPVSPILFPILHSFFR